jgi:hypothetical protein
MVAQRFNGVSDGLDAGTHDQQRDPSDPPTDSEAPKVFFLMPQLKTPMPVFVIVIAAVAVLLVPMVADKLWRCHEEDRAMAHAEKEIRVFYPGYTTKDWIYTKKVEEKTEADLDWQNVE